KEDDVGENAHGQAHSYRCMSQTGSREEPSGSSQSASGSRMASATSGPFHATSLSPSSCSAGGTSSSLAPPAYTPTMGFPSLAACSISHATQVLSAVLGVTSTTITLD